MKPINRIRKEIKEELKTLKNPQPFILTKLTTQYLGLKRKNKSKTKKERRKEKICLKEQHKREHKERVERSNLLKRTENLKRRAKNLEGKA